MQSSSNPMPNETTQKISEHFVSLLDRAQLLFMRLRELPEFGNQWEPYFSRAFDVYTRLWKYQQKYRSVLECKEGYALKRWEIGEIASKIGQLYYHYYLRTSDINYLQESFVFYDAIRSRAYFKDVIQTKSQKIMVKKLRYFAHFIVVALLLKRQEVVKELVASLAQNVNSYMMLKPDDAADWQSAIQEITLFLQADSPLLLRPQHQSTNIMTFSGRTCWTRERESHDGKSRKIQAAILVANRSRQVKFSELTLDILRMMLTLEPVLPVDPQKPSKVEQSQYRIRKYFLYRPLAPQVLYNIASTQKELPENGVLLLYFSADGCNGNQIALKDFSKGNSHPAYSLGGLSMNSPKKNVPPVPTIYSTQDCLYPEDLMPFLRYPLFIIVESNNSTAFLSLSNTFGVPLMVLCSPKDQPTYLPDAASTGSLFTFFLHSPLDAFCFCIQKTDLQTDDYRKCYEIIHMFEEDFSLILTEGDLMPHACAHFLSDSLLRQLIVRFIFCNAVLKMHVLFRVSKYLPSSYPRLPNSILQSPKLYSTIELLAQTLGGRQLFIGKNHSQPPTSRGRSRSASHVSSNVV